MNIKTVFAHLSCSDLAASARWYGELFGDPPMRRPMPGLMEWQFSESAALQLYEDAKHAGAGTLTLGVVSAVSERDRLEKAGLNPGPLEPTMQFLICRLYDPDRNLIVLAGPKEE